METNPNEPTLTCSEVVERLAKCVMLKEETYTVSAWLNKTEAKLILDEWREQIRKGAKHEG